MSLFLEAISETFMISARHEGGGGIPASVISCPPSDALWEREENGGRRETGGGGVGLTTVWRWAKPIRCSRFKKKNFIYFF